jgi:hypothetical protein
VKPVPTPEPEPAPAPRKPRKWLWVILIILGVLLVLFAAFILLGRLAPELVDPLLYSKEELEILRY